MSGHVLTPEGPPGKGPHNLNGAIAVNLHNEEHQAPTTAPVPPLPLLWICTKGARESEATGNHVEVEATHPRQNGSYIQLDTQKAVSSTALSAHHMSGSARDHRTANDKPSCHGHKVVLCDAVVACILPGQGSRLSWSAQATVDNGTTVGSERAVEVGAENGNKEQTAPRPGPHLPPERGRRAGPGMFQQSKLGNLNLVKSGQHPRKLHRHPPGPDFLVLSLPGGP